MNRLSSRPGRRGQSETLGFILVFGIVLLGALVVVVLGVATVDDTQERLSEDRAENILTEFDSKAALVALGESHSHRISFGSGPTEQFSVREDDGWMNVTATNRATDESEEMMNVTLGAIVYESTEAKLAYQGGGVWRIDDQGGQMVSPPEFHYRGATLTLPTVTITGDPILGTNAVIRHEQTNSKFPDPENGRFNPLDNHIVTVSVGSEYYRGWGEYFEERTDGDVAYDHDREVVELTLTSPIGEVRVEGAVAGQASGGTLNFQANPSHPCHQGGSPKPVYFDSYNSSNAGNYCDQYDEDEVNSAGDIAFGGDITSQAAAGQLQGNLVSGGSVELFHQQDLHGNVSYVDSCTNCEEVQQADHYWVEQHDGVEPEPAIDFVIENTLETLNDNLDPIDIGDGDEYGAGSYVTEELDLNGDSVLFDTSDGEITLGVNSTITLGGGANITVVGENDLNIYVRGVDGETDLDMTSSVIYAPENDATLATVLGGEDFSISIDGGEFNGVLYAPTGLDGDGSTVVSGGGQVYGGIVTGDMTIGHDGGGGQGGTVHYDKALEFKQVVPPDRTIVRLTFLHVTENQISISR